MFLGIILGERKRLFRGNTEKNDRDDSRVILIIDEVDSATNNQVFVDYLGEQFIVELKIWHGNEYDERGEAQLAASCSFFHG